MTRRRLRKPTVKGAECPECKKNRALPHCFNGAGSCVELKCRNCGHIFAVPVNGASR